MSLGAPNQAFDAVEDIGGEKPVTRKNGKTGVTRGTELPIDTALEVGLMSRSVFDEQSSRTESRTGNAVGCCTRVEEERASRRDCSIHRGKGGAAKNM